MMLARNPFLPNPPGARYPTRQEIWPAEQRGGHPQPNDAPAGCRRDAESRARFLAPSTDRRKPAGRRIEWRAVVSARTCVHRGCEECGGANQFGAYGKPPDKCLVTGMTALAKVFKLRQNRLLRYLLPFGILVHRVTPLNQYCGRRNRPACHRPPPARLLRPLRGPGIAGNKVSGLPLPRASGPDREASGIGN